MKELCTLKDVYVRKKWRWVVVLEIIGPEKTIGVGSMERLLRLLGIEATGENRGLIRCGWVLAGAAVVLRLAFWAYTGRLWEDALITVLHSENAVAGFGLTHHHVDEPPIHGFTSPLSVLVPLMGDLVHMGWGIHFIRLVSAFAGGLAVLYALGIAIHPRITLPAPMAILVMGYLAFEHHQILYGMAGMETQITTCILLASFYFLIAERPAALGLSLGLCMLARPDFAFWTVIAGVYGLFRLKKRMIAVVAIAVGLYLPWIVFTTWYYGSPIPNTVLAKNLGYYLWTRDPNLDWSLAWHHLRLRVTGNYGYETVFQPLGPCFGGHGTHFRPLFGDRGLICGAMTMLACVGAAAALWRRQWAFAPFIGFAACYACYYIFLVAVPFGWYLVPFLASVVWLSARGLQAVAGLAPGPRARFAFLTIAAALYLAPFVVYTPKTFLAEKQIQEQIENNVRKPIGLYLNRVMQPNETVACECLGYVSYYSRRTVYDWPGLASRKVVAFSRAHPEIRSLMGMIATLKPDYLVLRHHEYVGSRDNCCPWLATKYKIVAAFEAPREKIRDIFLIDQNIDLGFYVLKRTG